MLVGALVLAIGHAVTVAIGQYHGEHGVIRSLIELARTRFTVKCYATDAIGHGISRAAATDWRAIGVTGGQAAIVRAGGHGDDRTRGAAGRANRNAEGGPRHQAGEQ